MEKEHKAEQVVIDKYLKLLGKESISHLKSRDFHFLDPLVSDCACHLRATWLLLFVRSHKSFDNIAEDDLKILGLLNLLTKAKISEYYPNANLSWLEKTDTHFIPDGWEKFLNNKKKRRQLFPYTKLQLANSVLTFVKNKIASYDTFKHKEAVLQFFSEDVFIQFHFTYLPYVATFPSLFAVLEIGLIEKVPIVLIFYQIMKDNISAFVNGIELLLLEPQSDKYNYYFGESDSLIDIDDPVFLIEFAHYVSANESLPNKDVFKQALKHLQLRDPHEALLQSIALHSNYSTNCYIKVDDEFILMKSINRTLKSNDLNHLQENLRAKANRPDISLQKLRNFELQDVHLLRHLCVGTLRRAQSIKNSLCFQ